MKKVGRNERCPCGSGKKYKHCCGKSKVIPFRIPHLDEELEKLHEEFFEFAMSYYEREIDVCIQEYVDDYILAEENEELEIYTNLLIPWIIIFEPLYDNKSVLEIFAEQRINKMKDPRVQKALLNWQEATTSIFQIKSIKSDHHVLLTTIDVFTGRIHEIKFTSAESESLKIGDYLLGTLASFIHYEKFILLSLIIEQDRGLLIDHLLDLYDGEVESSTELFPEWLGDLIEPDSDDLVWMNVKHERVAHLLYEQLLEEDVSPEIIDSIIQFWNIYCLRNNPSVIKIASYTAGLYYLVMKKLLVDNTVTQAKAARKFGVSPTTVSNRYQDFALEFDIIFDEYESEEDSLEQDFDLNSIHPAEQERMMATILEKLDKHDFESEAELESFLDNMSLAELMGAKEEIDLQDLLVQASETWGRERKAIVDHILEIDPNNVDAYLLLAEMIDQLWLKCEYVEKAVGLGERSLGKKFFEKNTGHFWGLIETRPYMRALAYLGQLSDELGRTEEAIKHFERLIELNPNDNQGIREDLMPIYIESEAYEAALDLFEQYSEYPGTHFLYSRALIEILQDGYSQEAKDWLIKAIESNEYVVDYLTGRNEIPDADVEYFQPGDDSEAIIYVQKNFHLWDGHVDIFDLL